MGIFVWKDGKFIMGKRVGTHGQNTWSVPGGWLEFGETWEDCALREVREETSLIITNVRVVAVTNNFFLNENKHSITVWADADWESGTSKITEPDKFIDQGWYTFKTLPSPLFEPCWQNLRVAKPELFT